jgi:hypothetical protein
MLSCSTCGQSMFELGAGFHVVDGGVEWLALGVRCVGCGTLDGVTDMSGGQMPLDEVSAGI